MKNLVILDYSFMFDPGQSWSNLYQFENEILQFFDERGMDAQVIKTAQGSSGRRAILLCPKEEIKVSLPVNEKTISLPKQQLKNIQKGLDNKKGK